MDLDHAQKVVGSYARLHGESSDRLIERVKKAPDYVAPGKTLSPATSLECGVVLRPIDALHQLAYATAPRYQDNVLDRYAQWGLLRYLGFFDISAEDPRRPKLEVSDAGGHVVGNQRRVASEEMGIAFGALLARRWFAWTGAHRAPVSIVDVDVALDDRYVFAGGARRKVRKTGKHRPDYLLVAADPRANGRYRIRALECKGTKSPSTAVKQLAKAVRQLDGIAVDGRIPAGLATSVIASDDSLSYLAIDPADEEEPTYEVNSAAIDDVRNFRWDEDTDYLPPRSIVNAAASASWAMLADFGDNFDALERWAPRVMRTRLVRDRRNRVEFGTPYGDARGTSVTFRFAEGRITARHAISKTVDQALSQGTAGDIIEAQMGFAERLPQPENQDRLDDALEADVNVSNETYSASADGSIFSLSFS